MTSKTSKTSNVRHIRHNDAAKGGKKPAVKTGPREIDHVETAEQAISVKCARSKESIARAVSRMAPEDKAVYEAAMKVHGVKAQLERELLAHGNVVVQVCTNTVHYKDGGKAQKDPYVKFSRVEALAA